MRITSIYSEYSPASIFMKYRDHDSPITRLANLQDLKIDEKAKKDQILYDRSNEIFIPKNASKFSKDSYQTSLKTNAEIQEIKKKYYQKQNVSQSYSKTNFHPNDRPITSQNYQFQDKINYQKCNQLQENSSHQKNYQINDGFDPFLNKDKSYSNRQNIQKPDESIKMSTQDKLLLQSKQRIVNLQKQNNLSPFREPSNYNQENNHSAKSNYQNLKADTVVFSPERKTGNEAHNEKYKLGYMMQSSKYPSKGIFQNQRKLAFQSSIKKEYRENYAHQNYNKGNFCQKSVEIKKVSTFEQQDRVKQLENKIKQREQLFKKKEQQLRQRYENINFTPNNKSSKGQDVLAHRKNSEFKYDQKKQQKSDCFNKDSSANKINSEIQRLENKIKQFENRKKEMNIDYKPYEKIVSQRPYSINSQIKNQSNPKQSQKISTNDRSAPKKKHQVVSSSKNCNNQEEQDWEKNQNHKNERQIIEDMKKERSSFIQNTKPIYSEKTLPSSKNKEEKKQFAFQLFRIQSQPQQSSSKISKVSTASNEQKSKVSNSSEYSQKNLSQRVNQMEIQKRADQGREQRKKKLQQRSIPEKTYALKKLVGLLTQQCLLDEEFRNNKIWFNSNGDQKWKQVKKYLREYSCIKVSLTENSKGTFDELNVSEDENNPFFSVNQTSKFSYESLIKSYINCVSHWKEKISGKFDKLELIGQSFNKQKFDLEKKGHVQIQDLVRFLNIQSGNFYRNRDLYLVYQRFSNENRNKQKTKLTFDQILNSLTF